MANQSFGMAIGQGGADTVIQAMLGLCSGELGGEMHARYARSSALVCGPTA